MAKKTKAPAAPPPATTATTLAAAPVTAATETKAPFRVFYSWQSDLPNNRNRGLINDALEKAAKEFKKRTGVEMIVDEATSDTTGAVRIDDKIFEKIREADYFVADLTPVDQNAKRMLPNPNVCIELGYAVAELGWDRTGLAVNLAYGAIADLPFDVEKRRARAYTSGDSSSDEERQKSKRSLVSAFVADAEGILRNKPVKARLLAVSTPESINHEKDRRNLERVLHVCPPHFVDELIDDLGNTLLKWSGPMMCEQLIAIVDSTGFRVSDEDVRGPLVGFCKNFSDIIAITGKHNRDTAISHLWRIDLPEKMEKPYSDYLRGIDSNYRRLMELVAERFPEIDLENLQDS